MPFKGLITPTHLISTPVRIITRLSNFVHAPNIAVQNAGLSLQWPSNVIVQSLTHISNASDMIHFIVE